MGIEFLLSSDDEMICQEQRRDKGDRRLDSYGGYFSINGPEEKITFEAKRTAGKLGE
jgi:hypothetical protein